jgi:hypothetical protein
VLETGDASNDGDRFDDVLRERGLSPLVRGRVQTLQVNVGKLCNQACHHCHAEAGPKRTEIMPRDVAERVAVLLAQNPGVDTIDLTGGAPELNPNFRWLVTEARRSIATSTRCSTCRWQPPAPARAAAGRCNPELRLRSHVGPDAAAGRRE